MATAFTHATLLDGTEHMEPQPNMTVLVDDAGIISDVVPSATLDVAQHRCHQAGGRIGKRREIGPLLGIAQHLATDRGNSRTLGKQGTNERFAGQGMHDVADTGAHEAGRTGQCGQENDLVPHGLNDVAGQGEINAAGSK